MTFTIRPAATGGWLAFASGSLLLVVPDGSVAVDEGWAAVLSAPGFQSALDLLTGKGLAATPSFVLVDWQSGGDARVLVRGDLELVVTDASGEQQLSGAGVSTWVERSLPGVRAVSFEVPGAAPASPTELPLASGVALVAAIASGVPLAAASVPEPVAGAGPAAVAAPAAVLEPDTTREPAPRPAPEPIVEVDIGATVREAPHPERDAEEPPAPEGYDYLFGDTMYRGVAEAAVREPDPEAEGVVDDALHDGETVMVDSIKKLRGKRQPAAAAPAPAAPRQVTLLMPNGSREPLTQPILIGRSPTVGKVSGAIPRPLTLGTGDQDISRNHAQFALEGGTVVVTDLHSRNGTSIVLPGKTPQKLRAGEPTAIIIGTVVDFGGGLSITVTEEEK